ncbi:hypothetical protein ACF8C1_19375 [Pseudomonas sp. zjy_9]
MAIQIVTGNPGDGMQLNQLTLTTWALEAEFAGRSFDYESARLDPFFNAAVYDEYVALADSQPGQPAQRSPREV